MKNATATEAGMWDELGIAPCEDPKAIRRAYAARLKKLDPDRDPEAFARLRKAFERALNGAVGDERPRSSAASQPPASTESDADAAEEDRDPTTCSAAEADHSQPAAAPSSVPHPDNRQDSDLRPPAPAPDRDDVRERALLIALDAALRRRDGKEATVLYYRAAATGALSLESAPDVIERLLAVAVDDPTLDAAAFRHLVRTAGVDTPRSRGRIVSELHKRVLARLRAEDWYEDLLATAKQRKGRIARRRAKIARLILQRIGRHWHPRVDKTALRSWLDQYKTHAAWLTDRIDPAWVEKLDNRLRRRELFWVACYTMLIAGLLFQLLYLLVFASTDGEDSLWSLLFAPFAALFLLWLLKLLATELLRLSIAGAGGFAGIAPLHILADRIRAIWSRLTTKGQGDAG
jgi:hypothetical protein